MPHQCVRCNSFYDDGSEAILKGCSCGGKLFFYIRPEKLEKLRKEIDTKLTKEGREKIEEDVYDLLDTKPEEPVVLDFESIRVLSPGKYELDIIRLFKNDAVVFKLEDGKYVIDIPETFQRMRRK